jgi:hypothetical protein
MWADAVHPRFPLGFRQDDAAGRPLFLPLGVGTEPAESSSAGPQDKNALVRDGLERFDSSVFLDPALMGTRMTDLIDEANRVRYQSGAASRDLTGIHSALAIDEATLIAVPDSVQRGWNRATREAIASPPPSSPLQHPEWWHSLECRPRPAIPRVPAPPSGQFLACDVAIVPPPLLSTSPVTFYSSPCGSVGGGGTFSLAWTPPSGSAPGPGRGATDVLEESADPGFESAGVIFRGSSNSVTFSRPAGDYYYRVRRELNGGTSDYSNGVAVRIDAATDWQEVRSSDYSDHVLLDVHRALLRMSAARGDLLAALVMPEHYRERDVLTHAGRLGRALGMDFTSTTWGVPPLQRNEQSVLSFGALYHPWLVGREENDLGNLRSNPPDGAVLGIIAMRAIDRGAWVAPANEQLHGVVELSPQISRNFWQALQDASINVVRHERAGFLCLSAETLSDDPDLGAINVRRLLSLLRKTAVQVGSEYVFEPNGDDFRRAVERGFATMLNGLYQRGAFAGRTSREGFEVVADDSLNTADSVDQGRFYVVLKVAPSLPLRFLTIKLLQTSDRTFVTEGA